MENKYIIFYRFNHKPMRIAFTNRIYITSNPKEIEGKEHLFYIQKFDDCNYTITNEIVNYK